MKSWPARVAAAGVEAAGAEAEGGVASVADGVADLLATGSAAGVVQPATEVEFVAWTSSYPAVGFSGATFEPIGEIEGGAGNSRFGSRLDSGTDAFVGPGNSSNSGVPDQARGDSAGSEETGGRENGTGGGGGADR
jgi:hypothetical protein